MNHADGNAALNWDEKPNRLPLGTRVRLLKHDNIEGWVVAYQSIDGLFYYVSTESPVWIPQMPAYTAISEVVEVIP